MFYNRTFNKANLNLLIYKDLPEALKLQKMCKLNSLAVTTAQTVEIKPFASQSSSKWIPGFIANKVYFKKTEENQIYKRYSRAKTYIHPSLSFQIRVPQFLNAVTTLPQHHSLNHTLRSLILRLPGFFFTNKFWTHKSRVCHAVDL